MSRILFLLLLLFSSLSAAEEWPSVIRIGPSIVCDTESQATEIIEVYQSEGVSSAAKVLKRLLNEKNENNEGKCVITPGVYLFRQEKLRIIIEDKNEDFVAVVLEVYDPRIKETVYVILGFGSKPSL